MKSAIGAKPWGCSSRPCHEARPRSVVSDSHGRFRPLERMISQAPDVAAWIHCGDYSDDGDDLAIYTGVPVYSVRGNNDFMSDAPACRKVTIGGVNIIAVHGHQWYGEARLAKLRQLGREHEARLVLFGHTHRRFCQRDDDMTIVNPGSVSLPRDAGWARMPCAP